MTRKLILYFSAEARALYRWRRREPELDKRLADLAELRRSLARHRGALLHVVVDLAAEDFHEEQIPLLRGSERRIVIERRLAQRHGEVRFAAALSLGPASGGRRGERLLLVALPQSGPFAEWFEALRQAPVTLASVVSTGLLAPALAHSLGLGGATTLLVSANGAGLRQSFLERGRLRFSRLEPASADALSPAFVLREVERTLQFLESSRALDDAGSPLRVALVVPKAERARFEAALESDGRLAFAILGVGDPDSLYLRLAAIRPRGEQFLRAADRRPFFAWRLRRALVAIGASAFAACAAYAGLLWLESREVRAEIASVRQQVAPLRAEERRLRAQLPATPASADTVKAAALEFRRIVAATAAPEAAWIHLSSALDQAPEIELDALAWESTDAGGQALELSARVQASPQADYREIGRQIERFSKLLASGDWQVSATRLPFDAGPQSPLAGDFGVRDAAERTRFAITLSRAPR